MNLVDVKRLLGQKISGKVENNQVLGLGSGTTAEEAIKAIGERIKEEKLKVYGVPTSKRVEKLAKSLGITTIPLGKRHIDWGFDGADEVEKRTLNLIKGGGGAMTMEKKIAKKCPVWIVIVDETKLSNKLAERAPIPVEVEPNQMGTVRYCLAKDYRPEKIEIRQKKDGNGMSETELGNRILDVFVSPGSVKDEWEKKWEEIPGVIGTGLFLGGYPDEVWVADSSGEIQKIKGTGKR